MTLSGNSVTRCSSLVAYSLKAGIEHISATPTGAEIGSE